MKITRISGRDLTGDHLRLWTEIQQSDSALGSPYFCAAFTGAVAAVRDDVEVAVMEEGGQPVGFLPYQRGAMGIGRPVGGALSDYQGAIVRPGVAWDPAPLLRGARLSVWEFDHLLAGQTPFQPYHQRHDYSPVMDLSQGYDAYIAQRRAAGAEDFVNASDRERQRRKLEREIGPLRFVTHANDPALLQQLIQWKSAQYRATGITDVLSFPWIVRLLERILAVQTEDFAGMLSALYAGNTLLSVHMGMRSRTVWHCWFPTYDVDYRKFSPGLNLMLKMAQAAPALGLKTLDLGKGESMYKKNLANGAVPLAEGAVELPSLARIMRQVCGKAKQWADATSMPGSARLPGRVIRRIERRLRFS